MRLAVVLAAVLVAPSVVSAKVFGGFSADETTYLRGRDRVCQPIKAGSQGQGKCRQADAGRIAQGHYRTGSPQRGTGGYRAQASGMTLRVAVPGQAVGGEIRWSAFGVISRVSSVYVSPKGRLVAVEFETRVAGRPTADVVVFDVSQSRVAVGGGAASVNMASSSHGPGAALVPADVDRPAELKKALARADQLRKKRRYAKALDEYRAVLAVDRDDAAAHYGAAAVAAQLGRHEDALAALRKLAASPHAEVPIWLVAARTDDAFKAMRTDSTFRMAIGLDPGERVLSAYERVLGLGGAWEQSGAPCSEPQVSLKLMRKKWQFELDIRDRCQGQTSKISFGGTWTTRGTDRVSLILPNQGGADETLACEISSCSTGGEDCLHCRLDRELDFTLRVVRR